MLTSTGGKEVDHQEWVCDRHVTRTERICREQLGALVFLWGLCCKFLMIDKTDYFKVTFKVGEEFKLLSHPFLKCEQESVMSIVLFKTVAQN